jgi:hypothetical protein
VRIGGKSRQPGVFYRTANRKVIQTLKLIALQAEEVMERIVEIAPDFRCPPKPAALASRYSTWPSTPASQKSLRYHHAPFERMLSSNSAIIPRLNAPAPAFSGDNLYFGLSLGNLRQQVGKAAGSLDIREVVQKEIPHLTETSASGSVAPFVPAGNKPGVSPFTRCTKIPQCRWGLPR